MGQEQRRHPAYLRPGGRYWRAVAALAFFQALCWGGAAALAWLIISPELAKDYFSAHHTVKATSRLVVPGLAVAAGVGLVVAVLGSALSIWSYSRRLFASLRPVDDLLHEVGAGRVPAPGAGGGSTGAAAEAVAALEPLRAHVQQLQAQVRDLQKLSLDLNYRSSGGEVTLKDLRELAARLDALASGLGRSAGWFES